MSWNNNQPNLPFSANEPQRGPFTLTLNNPPYVPGNYNGPQVLQQILPLVAAASAMEIQQNAPKNPLRMFMFNQYSRSEPGNAPPFTNPDFDALVLATMEYITLEMNNNRYGNVEQAAQNCVPQMCEMLCAINMRLYPDLEAYINQNVAQTLRNTISQFDRIAQQIKNMKQQQSGWNNNQGGNQGWGNTQGNNAGWGNSTGGNNWGGGNTGGSNNRWNNTGGWGNSGAKPSTGSSGGLFNGVDRRGTGTSNSTTNTGSRWDDDKADPLKQPYQSRDNKDTTVNQQAQEQQQPDYIEASLQSGDIAWVPSNKHPYLPACAPSVGEIWLRKHKDGTVEPFLKEKEESPLDYDRHATGHVFGPAPRSLDLSNAAKTMANIEEGIRKINNATAAPVEDKDKPEVSTYVAKEVMLETSLEAAWLLGSLNRLTAPADKIPDVYRAYIRLADPVITKVDETDTVKSFGQAKTYMELREKINAAVGENAAPGLWGRADAKMTKLVNRVLSQKLALPELSIDSFLEDIESLISYLGTRYGQNIQQAFLKNQKTEIQSAFLTLAVDTAKDMTEAFIGERKFEEGATPIITYLGSAYSLTYLNCLSYELDIDLAKNLGTLVTDALSPILHQMLVGLFAEIAERDTLYERHLLMTNDGRVLEATQGYLGEKAYMLTLIK